jgi:hypothetical protein
MSDEEGALMFKQARICDQCNISSPGEQVFHSAQQLQAFFCSKFARHFHGITLKVAALAIDRKIQYIVHAVLLFLG